MISQGEGRDRALQALKSGPLIEKVWNCGQALMPWNVTLC